MRREELARKIAEVISGKTFSGSATERHGQLVSIILSLLPEDSQASQQSIKCNECKQPVCDHVAQRVFNLAKQAEYSGWVACAERLPETHDYVELAWGDEPAYMPPAIGYFEKIGEQAGHWWGGDGKEASQYSTPPKFWRPRRPIGTLLPAPGDGQNRIG